MADGLIHVDGDLVRTLDLYTASIDGQRWMGLMKGTVAPLKTWNIGNVVPATFSGYGGVQVVMSWQPAVLVGHLAVATALEIVWMHDGGVGSCDITGYYVVDSDSKLCWVEFFDEPWQTMAVAGDRFSIVPTFAHGSRFPIED